MHLIGLGSGDRDTPTSVRRIRISLPSKGRGFNIPIAAKERKRRFEPGPLGNLGSVTGVGSLHDTRLPVISQSGAGNQPNTSHLLICKESQSSDFEELQPMSSKFPNRDRIAGIFGGSLPKTHFESRSCRPALEAKRPPATRVAMANQSDHHTLAQGQAQARERGKWR